MLFLTILNALRNVWRSVFFLIILVCNLIFWMYIFVSRKEILSFDISYSNLIDGSSVFYSCLISSRSVLLPVHIKKISTINLRYVSKDVFINGHMNFLSKWSIRMFPYEAHSSCWQKLEHPPSQQKSMGIIPRTLNHSIFKVPYMVKIKLFFYILIF